MPLRLHRRWWARCRSSALPSPTVLRVALHPLPAARRYAAGAIDLLVPLAAAADWDHSVDMHPKALAAWMHVMLAQAQQCFYEKACVDQMKPAVVAKLAAQVATSFESAVASLRHKDLKEKVDKWPVLLEGATL